MAKFTKLMYCTYHFVNGISAYDSKSHCAAILTIKQEGGGAKYKIQNTRDSPIRCIGE